MEKIMVTRLSVINDERNLLLGKDGANIFEKGMVYEVVKILDQIVIREIGKSIIPETGHPSIKSDNNTIICYGEHLLTQEDKDNREKNIQEKNMAQKKREDECGEHYFVGDGKWTSTRSCHFCGKTI